MRKLTVKQELFCKAMFTPGSETLGNGVKSAKKAGYKGSYGSLNEIARGNLQKLVIIEEKNQIQAEANENTEIDRDYCIEETQHIIETTGNERLKLAALSLIGDFIGAKREVGPNKEREAAKIARMTDEERIYRADWERRRADELSQGGLRVAKRA